MRRSIYAVLLVASLQILWVAAEGNGWSSPGKWHRVALKVSLGFPSQCIFFTTERTTGDIPAGTNYPEKNKWLPGLWLSPASLTLDALIAVAAFFGFRWLLRFQLGRAASAGFLLGMVAGVLNGLDSIPSWRPLSSWILLPLLWIGIPFTVCLLTRRARSIWSPLLMLAVAMSVLPWMSDHADFLGSGFSFDAHSFRIWKWYPSIEDVLIALAYGAVLAIPVFLIRRFVPGLGSKCGKRKPHNDLGATEERPATCSKCGSPQVAKIQYGLPNFSDELKKEIAEGKTVLGGCVVDIDNPQWECRSCKHHWGTVERLKKLLTDASRQEPSQNCQD